MTQTEAAPTPAPAPPAPVAAPAKGELPLSLRALLDAGVHFGHQTKRWNPKMRPFIYGARNGVHIVDLDQTARMFKRAYEFVVDAVGRGGHVLFVGTKRQAQDIVVEEALRAGMYFVTNRWLGGTLTNFRTLKGGLDRLRTLERMKEDGTYEQLPKKEVSRLEKERERLEKYVGGLKTMSAIPHAVFVIDPHQETIAVAEARKLNIPVIAITDTNCDPDMVDFIIPGNDDAIRSIRLITGRIADACVEGLQRRKENPSSKDGPPPQQGRQAEVQQRGGGRGGRGDRRDQQPSSLRGPPRRRPRATPSSVCRSPGCPPRARRELPGFLVVDFANEVPLARRRDTSRRAPRGTQCNAPQVGAKESSAWHK